MASTTSWKECDKKSIALCQICPVIGDIEANKLKIIHWMKKASLAGADLALFGELALTGCELENLHQVSETKDGPTAEEIARAAKELGIAVIYGYSEVENNKFFDSVMFIDKHGTRLANYRKVHNWQIAPMEYASGDAVTVVDWENLRIGLAIGEDVCFPEFFRAMVQNGGAQFVAISAALSHISPALYPANVFLPARALENRCYIAHADLAGEKFLGMTKLFNPLGEYQESSEAKTESMLLAEVPLYTYQDVPFHYLSYLRPEIYDGVIPYATEVPWNRQTEERTQEFFNHRANYYDRQMNGMYNAPSVVARALSEVVANKNGKLLDIAAGTGLIGKALYSRGFRNLVALDRNKKMLEKAATKNIYSKLIVGPFEQEAVQLAKGSFHVCVCVGAFLTEAWLDPSVTVQEMSRLVESGGYLLLSWNATELEEGNCQAVRKNLDAALKEIVNIGECKWVLNVSVPNYLKECEGTLCILKKN